MKTEVRLFLILVILAAAFFQCSDIAVAGPLRNVVSLDGTWQIAEGNMTNIPAAFDRNVPVPGLVDMAQPPFVEAGPRGADRGSISQKDPRRDAFWYRRTFTVDGPIPAVAKLKIGKAMFGTRVFLNGKLLGDHAPCFTPGYFDAKEALKIGRNELIVRVGADRDAVSRAYPDGFDFEKERYIPGIFDSVTLTFSGTPNIQNVQVAPDLTNRQARVRAWLNGGRAGQVFLEIREAKSGKVAGRVTAHMDAMPEQALDVAVPIAQCHLWSPEDPFLYELVMRTSGDEFTTRFGMREFRFDPATGRAMLNGRPYFMRGSNFTLYRFFEDSECGNLPWNEKWVRRLHQRVKDMHWNCLRYCIGFPPEPWYDIADEEGILIDDEFPIWFGGSQKRWPSDLKSEELATEYKEWMRERWNHPCVVVWDGNNETINQETGPAIQQVRALDLSNRPWDNSYNYPQEPGDMFESHPYHFGGPGNFKLADLATAAQIPQGNVSHNDGKHAVVINEYGWLWLNRDGTPTTLTEQLYQNLSGTNSTTAQRFHIQATYLAAETEFWRAHRNAAAVMHFTTLGYARPDGQTSDHWIKGGVAKLQWEPEFHKYVRDAFAPVGMMIDFWNNTPSAGTRSRVPVMLINDLYESWNGPVTLRVKRGDKVLVETKQDARIEPLGTTNVVFDIVWPEQTGPCVLEAELRGADGKPVHSVRDLEVLGTKSLGLAFGKPVSASSTYAAKYKPENAVDGNPCTYWSSEFRDDAWFAVDFGEQKKINRVVIQWEAAFAKSFSIQVSTDGQSWAEVFQTEEGKGGVSEIALAPVAARHIRLNCAKRGTPWGNAVYEMQVFEPTSSIQ
jgi:beta-galactosidase